MFKGHVNYNLKLNENDFKDIVNEIEKEKNNENVDRYKLNKLEEAKLMRQLFNNANNFSNANRNFNPW